ncbi:methylmalonyl-CoA mutase family protein [Limibacterium fermenti]|uniref:methylmalonyl-CoA mutase family protein n=1 Tax=Limibacterium fermenti TaxID=3229863 RepID=UPI000E81C0DB|nr:methylmalonyl-CoA mutase small subunit [Porphyromonadaceae bacterium]
MSDHKENFFVDFPPTSTDEWMEKITADLKGADFQKKLVWRTNEGFTVNPFYRAENVEGLPTLENLPGQFPYVRSTKKDNVWYIRREIHVDDFAEANKKAVKLLTKGITSFGFHLPKNGITPENIKVLLKDISPEKVELNFRTCISRTLELARVVSDYLLKNNFELTKCQGSIEFDPFRKILKKGIDSPQWAEEAAEIVNITSQLPHYRCIYITGNSFSDVGAYIHQELGYSLSYGNQILGALIEKGIDPVVAANKIKFTFGIDSNYFMEIAKFRAARWLWAEIVNAYEPLHAGQYSDEERKNAAKMNVHAVTSAFNQSVFDPYVNLLRSQTEAMSATIASVDSLTVRPFNEAFETPTDFSERIAVNQQLLLKEEAHFDKIIDPSAGSYYIETLTSSIAEQAWKLFLKTEEQGFYENLKAGAVQDAVNASGDARMIAVAKRREVLVGTNQYPNFTERRSDTLAESHQHACGCDGDKETPFKKLKVRRLADDFNELRLATERSKKTPKVFMLTIGNLAMRLARSQFSANFFGCAGYELIDNLGFNTVEGGIKAAREKDADVIVLCSSDDEYVTYAPEAFDMLKGGKELFVVAGAPACMDDLKAQGIEHFIHVRSNVLETLILFHKLLGITIK